MSKYKKRLPLWITLSFFALVVLTACSTLLTSGSVATVPDGGESVALLEQALEESVPPEPASEEEIQPERKGNNVTILTEDDRPAGLLRLTQDWNTNWNRHSISYDEILSGGPPRDGIRSVDNPKFISPDAAAEWLADNEPVIALDLNGDARAYPLQIITWHEIVNDEVGGVPAVVTFCPLCNSALAFDRTGQW